MQAPTPTSTSSKGRPAKKAIASKPKSPAKPAPYSRETLYEWWSERADEGGKVLSVRRRPEVELKRQLDGLTRSAEASGLELGTISLGMLAYEVGAKEFGVFAKDSFVFLCERNEIDTDKRLRAYIDSRVASLPSSIAAARDHSLLHELYVFVFAYVRGRAAVRADIAGQIAGAAGALAPGGDRDRAAGRSAQHALRRCRRCGRLPLHARQGREQGPLAEHLVLRARAAHF